MESGLLDRIKAFEGYRRYAYNCCLGHLTIGYVTMIAEGGHGVAEYVGEIRLQDYLTTIQSGLKVYDWFTDLDTPRQHCILEMAYQMGVEGVLAFRNMIQSIERKDWQSAGVHALDSLWAKQTPVRARDVAERLVQG